MKLEIHRRDYGVTPDGEWFQKVEGDWTSIQQPTWYKKKTKQNKVVNITHLQMEPPPKKDKQKPWAMVTVYRVVEKKVPEYEAAVLLRNGWQDYYPGTLRHNDETAISN